VEAKNENRSAKEQALIRLNVREYSAGEMRAYLKRKGYEAQEIAEAVDALVSCGYISDERYSKIIARHSSGRSKGPGYIRMKLQQKGVSVSHEKARELFLENSGESELDLAKRLLQSRYPRALESPKERQRAYLGLIRRGISHDVAQACLKPSRE